MISSVKRRAAAAVLSLTCAWLVGCGGGGGGGDGGPITPQNRAPTFGVAQFSTTEEVDVSAQLTATDPDGDALTFTRTGDPGKGAVSAFAANGSFTYRPNRDAFGSDSFAVRVADSQGNGVNGTVTIQIAPVADPPTAHNDTLSASGAGVANLSVLANDVDPDGDALTVTIESAAEVGTASVNPNGNIAIAGLPAGFRGLTRFRYRATDPSGAFTIATAAVFVDTAPFRVIFNGDELVDGSFEVYMTDLVAAPVKLTSATTGSLRLRNFRASTNGSTVVYRRHDLSLAKMPTDLTFVRTADPTAPVRLQLPIGMQLVPTTANEIDWYAVSPDGQWIAAVAAKDPSGTVAVILLNVANPTVIHTASAPDTVNAQRLQFSSDSQHLYFLAGVPSAGVGIGLSLYRTAAATPDQSTLLSAPPATIADEVQSYAISADQSRILLNALRAGVTNLYYVNPANPRNEIRLNHTLNVGDQLFGTAYQRGDTVGGSADGARVGYSVQPTSGPLQSYIAEVSATPNARVLGPPGLRVSALRADNAAALLETDSQTGTDFQTFECVIDSAQTPALVADGIVGGYDATGDAVLTLIFHDAPQPVRTTGAALRPTFGTTHPVGTPGQVTLLTDVSGMDRGIVVMGESPQAANIFRMALVNVRAPDKLLYLADFYSTQTLKGGVQSLVIDP